MALPKIAINGFGRIGRTIMRIAKLRKHYDVVAVNDLASPDQLAYAFKYDSTHGVFPGEVSFAGDVMEIDGDKFKVLSERDPTKLPWQELGVDYVIESSGAFRHLVDLQKHIDGGAALLADAGRARGRHHAQRPFPAQRDDGRAGGRAGRLHGRHRRGLLRARLRRRHGRGARVFGRRGPGVAVGSRERQPI